MIDRTILKKLDDAFVKLSEVEETIRGICAEIARPECEEGKPVPKASLPPRSKDKGEGKTQRLVYWKKVVCAHCGATVGSRVVGDERFPLAHKSPAGRPCPGAEQSVGAGTRTGVCPRCNQTVPAQHPHGIFTPVPHHRPDGSACAKLP